MSFTLKRGKIALVAGAIGLVAGFARMPEAAAEDALCDGKGKLCRTVREEIRTETGSTTTTTYYYYR